MYIYTPYPPTGNHKKYNLTPPPSDIFAHPWLGPFFGVQNSEFQYFFRFSEKLIFFGTMKILWIFFGGHHKIGLVLGLFLCNLRSFFKVKVQNWDIFLGC